METCKRTKILLAVGLAVLTLLLTRGAPNAAADTSSFCLSVPNTAISGYTGPYVCVEINLTNATTATITFTSQTVGGYTFLMGDGSSAAVNVNASSWTLGSITGTAYFGSTTYSDSGSGQVDGFGVFNQTVDGGNGYTTASSSISFTITNAGGSWGSAADVLIANSGGSTAAAHIFVCDSSSGNCTAGAGAVATGFAANGSQVPEPATLSLLGIGLMGLGVKLRKRYCKK